MLRAAMVAAVAMLTAAAADDDDDDDDVADYSSTYFLTSRRNYRRPCTPRTAQSGAQSDVSCGGLDAPTPIGAILSTRKPHSTLYVPTAKTLAH